MHIVYYIYLHIFYVGMCIIYAFKHARYAQCLQLTAPISLRGSKIVRIPFYCRGRKTLHGRCAIFTITSLYTYIHNTKSIGAHDVRIEETIPKFLFAADASAEETTRKRAPTVNHNTNSRALTAVHRSLVIANYNSTNVVGRFVTAGPGGE